METLVQLNYFVDIFRNFPLADKGAPITVDLLNVDKLCDHVARSIDAHNAWNQVYLRNYVFKTFVWINNQQYNSSFLDVASGGFTGRRVGFSGTINIAQPRYMPACNKMEPHNWKMYELAQVESGTFLVPDRSSNGGIRSALLGIFDPSMRVFSRRQLRPQQARQVAVESGGDALLEFLVREDYDVFIDAGAFLRDMSALQVVQAVGALLVKHRKPARRLVFVDENDTLQEFVEQEHGYIVRPWINEPVSNLWIYYDHKHIVGIDVKQPFVMRGCVSVNFFNRITEVAQATFRLRNLNNGHRVDFVHFDNFAHVRDEAAVQLNKRMRAIEEARDLAPNNLFRTSSTDQVVSPMTQRQQRNGTAATFPPRWTPIPLFRQSTRARELGGACSKEELYEFLDLNERLMFLQMEQQIALQNLKTLRRLTTPVQQPAFLDDIFNPKITEVLSLHNEHEIVHQHDKWIQASLCDSYDGDFKHAVKNLCDELRPAALYQRASAGSAANRQVRRLIEESHTIAALRSTNVMQAQQVASNLSVNQNVSVVKNRQIVMYENLPILVDDTFTVHDYLDFANQQPRFLEASLQFGRGASKAFVREARACLPMQQKRCGITWSSLFFLETTLALKEHNITRWEQSGSCYLASGQGSGRHILCITQREVYALLTGLLQRQVATNTDIKLYNKYGLDLVALARGTLEYDPDMIASAAAQFMLGRRGDLISRIRLMKCMQDQPFVRYVLTSVEIMMGYNTSQTLLGEAFAKFVGMNRLASVEVDFWSTLIKRARSWSSFAGDMVESLKLIGLVPSVNRAVNQRIYEQFARAVEQVQLESAAAAAVS